MRKFSTFLIFASLTLSVSTAAWAQDAAPGDPAQPTEPAEPSEPTEPEAESQPEEKGEPGEEAPPAETPEAADSPAPPADPATPAAPMATDLEEASVGADATLTESAPAPAEDSDDWPMFTVAPHISVLLPQPFSDLGTWPVFGLEFGFIAPFDAGSMRRPLQISIDVGYTQPGASGTDNAPALGENGQDFDWELTQQMLMIDLTGLWRFMPPARGLSVYGEIGPRLYLLKSEVEASSAGQDFGTNDETKTQVGMVVAAGVEYWLAVGSLYGALEFGWSDLDTEITGDSNSGALTIDIGYRFMF